MQAYAAQHQLFVRLSAPVSADGTQMSNKINLYFGFSIGFSCQADNYKIPVQQQAVLRCAPYMNLFQKLKTIFTDTPQGETAKKVFSQIYDDNGRFSYDDDGFVFQFSDGPQKIFWSEIDRMTAYKVDLITIEELRLDIDFRGLTLPISEETPGFFQFVLKTKKVFPSIAKDWDLKIIHPAFEANETVIYERKQEEPFNGV